MCTELHHTCHLCENDYTCNEPDFVCATLNFDENANVCPNCEHEYWEFLLMVQEKENEK